MREEQVRKTKQNEKYQYSSSKSKGNVRTGGKVGVEERVSGAERDAIRI